YHSADIAFVFNLVEGAAYNDTYMQETSIVMSRAWAAFVWGLDPNGHGVEGYPTWPAWDTDNADGVGTNFVFDADGNPETRSHLELDNYRLNQTKYINTLWATQLNY
ncbi:hypothetical protein HK405_010785, partial [Cladochytrium tenue]